MITYVLFAIYAVCSGGGLLLLKIAMNQNPIHWPGSLDSFLNLKFISGFLLYVMGFLCWLIILSRFKLNFAFPIATSLFFIISLLGSYFILKEQFGLQQIIGIVFCFVGILLISLK